MAILVDAGPMVALLDRRQLRHEQCVELIDRATEPLVTCEAAVTEACYILRHIVGAARDLLNDVAAGRYLVEYRLADRADQVARLVSKYANVPMSLADACLVDLAEIHGTGRILTLDADFGVYRWGRNRPFELLLDV
jgi:predicted nucleic acid-binding protein